jgi:2-polyprenyl-6-methoxyphenol hydroxylase-like FAD-dependent oxidoreductase
MSEAAESTTRCCIVGGGPAGLILTLLLARRGIETVLLESHADFDRDYRGDTVHPPTLDLFDRLGILDRVLALPHAAMREFTPPGQTSGFRLDLMDVPHPYVAMMPQAPLLACWPKRSAGCRTLGSRWARRSGS